MVPSLPRILLNHDVAELRNTDGRELSSRIRVRGGPPLNIWTSSLECIRIRVMHAEWDQTAESIDEIDLAANPVRNYFRYEGMPHIMIRKSMQRLLP